MTKHLHCFTVVVIENESALIIGSKLNLLLVWRWVIQIGLLWSNAQPMICPQFLPEFPWSCLSWQDTSRCSRRKVAAQRALDFSQQTITWPSISSCFSSFISSFLLRRYIYKRPNLFFKYVNKFENRLYIYRYDWKDLNEFFLSGLWLIL